MKLLDLYKIVLDKNQNLWYNNRYGEEMKERKESGVKKRKNKPNPSGGEVYKI
jgi:hypothetical protein